MADRVLVTAHITPFQDFLDFALEHQLGVELMAFANPDILDNDWREVITVYKPLLEPLQGALHLHGPFMDMAPGSPDARINQVCIERYQQTIRIAQELNAEVIVFHANFIAAIHNEDYRISWQERNVEFWSMMADYADQHGVTLAVENMWEFDPDIIGDVLRAVDHPRLRACLDVGHAHLFSNVPFEDWLATIEPWLIHTHMNNNNGTIDVHQALGNGVVDYTYILAQLRALAIPPTMTLEMERVADMQASLPFLALPEPTETLSGGRSSN